MTKARKVQRTQKAGECGKQTKEKEGLWSLWSAPSSPCSSKLFTHSLKGNHHLTFLRFFNITFFTNRNVNETFRLPGYKTLYSQMYETNKTRSSEIRVAELGSLLSGAKMAMKIFVKRVFTIFASNASFLRVIANLQN